MIVRKLTFTDLLTLENILMDINKEEIRAMHDKTVTQLFTAYPHMIDYTDVVEVDGKLVAVGGSMDTDNGHLVWLFGTKFTKDNMKPFVAVTGKRIKELKKTKDVLFSYVYGKNEITKNWLKSLGFTIFDAKPTGVNDELFHYFEWRKQCAQD